LVLLKNYCQITQQITAKSAKKVLDFPLKREYNVYKEVLDMRDEQDDEFERNFEYCKSAGMHTFPLKESCNKAFSNAPPKPSALELLTNENKILNETILRMAKFMNNTDIDEDICKVTGICTHDCIKCIIDFFREEWKT
jgi:hypothetical protein